MGTVFSLEGIKTGQYSQELELLSWHFGEKEAARDITPQSQFV